MLDGRGMNPITMTRRITEHVTHIGLEMRMIGSMRKLVRVGEYEWDKGEIKIRDLVRYEESSEQWIFPQSFSVKGSQRISRIDPEGYQTIMALRVQVPC
jgi:pilus assembly protein CpaF